jgi:hypothetical protein
MRGLVLAFCLLLGLGVGPAFAQERASLTTNEALDLCDRWLAGALTARDVQLRGWRRMERNEDNIVLMPSGSSRGAMGQVSFLRHDYPSAEQRHCAFEWRFDDAANHLNDASSALSARGFETQVNQGLEAGEGVAASRLTGGGIALAQAWMRVLPCQHLVIGPYQGPCAQSTVAEFSLYVVETREKDHRTP